MTDSDPRRREKLRFRSWHCGMKEIDLILGRFADARLGGLSDAQLDRYEALLREDNMDIYNWTTGKVPPPPEREDDVMQLIRDFCMGRTE